MNRRAHFKYTIFGLAVSFGMATGALAQDQSPSVIGLDWLTDLNSAAVAGADDQVAAIAGSVAQSGNAELLYILARFYASHPSEHILPESDAPQAIAYYRQVIDRLEGQPGSDARRLLQRSQYDLASELLDAAPDADRRAEAIALLETAAQAGYGRAALALGVGLADGSLGTVDIDQSISWLRRALTAGEDEAALELARRLYDYGDDSQLEEAQGMARLGEVMLRRAALEGDTRAAVVLANAHLDHPLVAQDWAQAREWLEFAVNRGDTKAMVTLARLLSDGALVDPEPQLAHDLLIAAATEGSIDAAVDIAGSLLQSDTTPLPFETSEAQVWLDRAVAVESPRAFRVAAEVAFARGDFAAYRANLASAAALGETGASIDLIAWRIADGDSAGAQALMAFVEQQGMLSRSAMVDLAEIKLNVGSGSPLYDPNGALRLLREAGDQGDGAALYQLAMLHWDGLVVEQNLPQAVALLEESAATNYFRAMLRLVEVYDQGTGVTASPDQAEQWLERARIGAARQTGSEMLALGRALLDGLAGPDGTSEGLDWLQRAADHGEPRAMVALGNAYVSGQAGSFDPQHAFTLYQAAVDAGDQQANFYVARAYATGIGTSMDPAAALAAYTTAAEAGHAGAAAELGLIYSSNSDVPADYGLAYDWLRRAAEAGDVPAMIHIANLIEVGALNGITDDTTVLWLTRAAETGDSDAQFQLAVALKRGLLGAVDLEGAEYWMAQAADAGHFQAQSELQRMRQASANGS